MGECYLGYLNLVCFSQVHILKLWNVNWNYFFCYLPKIECWRNKSLLENTQVHSNQGLSPFSVGEMGLQGKITLQRHLLEWVAHKFSILTKNMNLNLKSLFFQMCWTYENLTLKTKALCYFLIENIKEFFCKKVFCLFKTVRTFSLCMQPNKILWTQIE